MRKLLFLFLFFSLPAFASLYSERIFNQYGVPTQGTVRICTSSAIGSDGLCTALATIYSDMEMTVPKSNPFVSDANGNFSFYQVGTFYIQVTGTNVKSAWPREINLPDTGGVPYFLSGGYLGGTWSKGTAADTYILALREARTLTTQSIGFNVELGLNPTSDVSVINFAEAHEIFTYAANARNFTNDQIAVYGSVNHFGSGSFSKGMGASFEAFNDGPGTATLLIGVEGTANNGGVAAGVPQQTPTNNGAATNLRAVDGYVSNSSSGTVGYAAAFYAESATNTGGGTITNNYGYFCGNQTAGSSDWCFYA